MTLLDVTLLAILCWAAYQVVTFDYTFVGRAVEWVLDRLYP